MKDPLLLSDQENQISKQDLKKEKKLLQTTKAIQRFGYKEDPYLNANCISKLFFYWVFRTIRLANQTPLKSEYLGKMQGKNSSKNYVHYMYDLWEKSNYKSKSNGLLKTILRVNLGNIIISILLSLILVSMEFGLVYIFRELIRSMKDEYTSFLEFRYLGLLFFGIKLINILLNRQNSIFQSHIGFKSSIDLNCFIYNKLLKTSPSSMREKSKEGEIINFIQVDSNNLNMTIYSCPSLIIVPIQIVVYSFMLFEFFGISFIFGFVCLGMALLINFCIQKTFQRYNKEMLKIKDSRMKITTETFNNLKILKLYAWEDEFLNRIDLKRAEEIKQYGKIFSLSNVSTTLLWSTPILVSVVSIGAYQYFVKELKIEDILTCVSIFNSIQEPIRTLPWTFNKLIECFNSMDRIEKYLHQDNIDENKITRNDPESIERNLAIKINNANFSWGKEIQEKKIEKDSKKSLKKIAPLKEEKKNKKIQTIDTEKNNLLEEEIKPNSENDSSNNETKKNVINNDLQNTNANNSINPEEPKIILKKINLEIKKGELLAIIGEVGAGKSSLLQAILNNMIILDESENDKAKIIINGEISYVSQIPWIENDTVRNNVLFNLPFDADRYDHILEISELKPDLEMFIGGDMTEIGEKGINLSGGQKARISIARSLYANNDIYIFDDPISALDAHVGQKIMEKCILDFLQNKTRILVTHAIQYLKYVDRIIILKDGYISWEGSYDNLVREKFYSEISLKISNNKSCDNIVLEKEDEHKEEEKSGIIEENLEDIIKIKRSSNASSDLGILKSENDKKISLPEEVIEKKPKINEIKRITVDEDKEVGSVKWSVYGSYLKMMGGYCVFFFLIFIVLTWQGLKISSDLFLTYWTKNQSEGTNLEFYWKYAALSMGSCFFVSIRFLIISQGSLRTSKKLHKEMITNLVRAPINIFHDTIPKGQILNRISKDMNTIDTWTLYLYGNIIVYLFSFFGAIAICSIMNIWCLIFLPVILLVGLLISKYYMSSSRDLARLDGIVRSPIINLLSATIPGSITIRAFRYEDVYRNKFYERVDEFYKVRLFVNGTSNWFGMYIDLLSVTFLLFLLIFLVIFKDKFSSQSTGLLLTYYIVLQDNIFRFLSFSTSFENCMVSLERCLRYLDIPQEKPYVLKEDESLKNWPSEGRIVFKDYSVRYRPTTEIVLKNLNLVIQPKEKVGVVGRTGSGKSTLCLCLFRILEPLTGQIFIDDLDISTVGLKILRNSITIIPQDPNLMEGTLKYNIDPLDLYSHEQIKEVLQMIGFWYIAENDPKGLELNISESGSNLSVGEKQLICITRAILRKSKIIVMDEATSSIDIKTEDTIQKAINQVMKFSTVITIAHRIKTIINYDKILVLDYGEIKEFDSPENLIKNTDSLFYELYKRSSL